MRNLVSLQSIVSMNRQKLLTSSSIWSPLSNAAQHDLLTALCHKDLQSLLYELLETESACRKDLSCPRAKITSLRWAHNLQFHRLCIQKDVNHPELLALRPRLCRLEIARCSLSGQIQLSRHTYPSFSTGRLAFLFLTPFLIGDNRQSVD